jgi:hypothetical protein
MWGNDGEFNTLITSQLTKSLPHQKKIGQMGQCAFEGVTDPEADNRRRCKHIKVKIRLITPTCKPVSFNASI